MLTELSDRIFLVHGENNGQYPHSHSLYIKEAGGVLVDCGAELAEIEKLKKRHGLATVILTHYHEDHFTHLSHLKDLKDLALWAPSKDADALESLDMLMWCAAPDAPHQDKLAAFYTEQFNYQPHEVNQRLFDEQVLELGGTRVVVQHVPGHTPGSIGLYFPDAGLAFLGDYDLSSFGPWYGDRDSDIDAFTKSARRLASLDASRFVVSHEEPLHDVHDMRPLMDAYLAVIERRDRTIQQLLRVAPRTMDEIVAARIHYGPRAQGPMVEYGEFALSSKHIKRLLARGEVVQEGDRFRLA